MDHAEQITVLSSMDGAVLTLTLSYERRRNALAPALKAALVAGLEQGNADPACRVIVVTGAGGHFCAGGDISGMNDTGGMTGRTRLGQLQHLIRLLVGGDTPVIAAVEGHAAGAGLSLAAACDIVVASSEVDMLAAPGEALATAQTLAAEIAERAPLSNTMSKALLGRATDSLEDLLRAEADAQGLLFGTEDFAEGREAFTGKRPPRFAGR
jgi:enoyl-CoA hydratase/carnithine racemase